MWESFVVALIILTYSLELFAAWWEANLRLAPLCQAHPSRLFLSLVIPDHANHRDHRRDDCPSSEACDQNKERQLRNIIPACFPTKESAAQPVEGWRPVSRPASGQHRLCFRCW